MNGTPTATPDARRTQSTHDLLGSRPFVALLDAYRLSGGMVRGDDLASLLQHHQRGDYVSLARLIASGGVFGFAWRQTFWIPMFQFAASDLSAKPGVRDVLSTLGGAFDARDRANWFAEPNAWLDDRRPADMLDDDLAAVLAAARADHLVAVG